MFHSFNIQETCQKSGQSLGLGSISKINFFKFHAPVTIKVPSVSQGVDLLLTDVKVALFSLSPVNSGNFTTATFYCT